MAELAREIDDLVRHERGRIVGALLRVSGSLDAAEDAFQTAALAALAAWHSGVPANPAAWLTTAAKNAARDARRHHAVIAAKAPLLANDELAAPDTIDTISDDHMRLVFACCHPALGLDNQIALTLKVVSGFTSEDIARAFVTTPATISQRILRAKQTISEQALELELPRKDQLGERVTAVLGVVYALFNEGHVARTGELVRLDLQAEALRLARLLGDLLPLEPEVFGLLAVVAFGAARAATRSDGDGVPILLADQDRARWHRGLIREAVIALFRARRLGGRGAYVLQAELAAAHVVAPSWDRTNWTAIVALYDELVAVAPSPIVSLNRAVAIAMRDGAEHGLAALGGLERPLASYHLFYATRAELLERAGQDGRTDLERALELVTNDGERKLLERRLTSVALRLRPAPAS